MAAQTRQSSCQIEPLNGAASQHVLYAIPAGSIATHPCAVLSDRKHVQVDMMGIMISGMSCYLL
jgi:hypothetical protein